MRFGDRLTQLRKELNMTQEELARNLSISRGTISMWEINQRTPDPDTLQRIADYFGVSVDYLLGRTDKRNPDRSQSDDLERFWPDTVRILRRAGRRMTPEERRRIARIIEAAVEDTEDEDEKT